MLLAVRALAVETVTPDETGGIQVIVTEDTPPGTQEDNSVGTDTATDDEIVTPDEMTIEADDTYEEIPVNASETSLTVPTEFSTMMTVEGEAQVIELLQGIAYQQGNFIAIVVAVFVVSQFLYFWRKWVG